MNDQTILVMIQQKLKQKEQYVDVNSLVELHMLMKHFQRKMLRYPLQNKINSYRHQRKKFEWKTLK